MRFHTFQAVDERIEVLSPHQWPSSHAVLEVRKWSELDIYKFYTKVSIKYFLIGGGYE